MPNTEPYGRTSHFPPNSITNACRCGFIERSWRSPAEEDCRRRSRRVVNI